MSQHNSNGSGRLEKRGRNMKYVINQEILLLLMSLEKDESSQKVGHHHQGPFGRLPSGGRKNYLAVLLFSCWLLVHSISLSSNLCEAITVPLCSGVLLIVGSYNLSPLTKQKGWLHISFPTNERSLRKSLDLSQHQ